jgi:hypothetical protein
VFPLGGQGPVLGHDSPAVGQLPGFAFAGVEHGFDGEHHARLEFDPFPGPAIVQHLQVLVVDLAYAVAAVFAHHAETLAVSNRLDGMADVAQCGAGLDLPDPGQHGFVSRCDQAPGQHAGGADKKHAAGVAEPAVLDDGDVDVDDVALFQNFVGRGDAVAHHLVDGGQYGLGIAEVAHVGGDGGLDIHDVLVADAVERLGADPGHDVRLDHAENLRGQLAGPPRYRDLLRRLDDDAAGHQRLPAGDGRGLPAWAVAAVTMSRPPASSAWTSSWQTSR